MPAYRIHCSSFGNTLNTEIIRVKLLREVVPCAFVFQTIHSVHKICANLTMLSMQCPRFSIRVRYSSFPVQFGQFIDRFQMNSLRSRRQNGDLHLSRVLLERPLVPELAQEHGDYGRSSPRRDNQITTCDG